MTMVVLIDTIPVLVSTSEPVIYVNENGSVLDRPGAADGYHGVRANSPLQIVTCRHPASVSFSHLPEA